MEASAAPPVLCLLGKVRRGGPAAGHVQLLLQRGAGPGQGVGVQSGPLPAEPAVLPVRPRSMVRKH